MDGNNPIGLKERDEKQDNEPISMKGIFNKEQNLKLITWVC